MNSSNLDELKNLVVNTLESEGILGKIRAQLKSQVFQIIEKQDPSIKAQNNFMIQNPIAAKIMETEDGKICADLVREFCDFFHLDYTLQVFLPECNLKNSPIKRDELEAKIGLQTIDRNSPLLFQLLANSRKKQESFVLNSNGKSPQPPSSGNILVQGSSEKREDITNSKSQEKGIAKNFDSNLVNLVEGRNKEEGANSSKKPIENKDIILDFNSSKSNEISKKSSQGPVENELKPEKKIVNEPNPINKDLNLQKEKTEENKIRPQVEGKLKPQDNQKNVEEKKINLPEKKEEKASSNREDLYILNDDDSKEMDQEVEE